MSKLLLIGPRKNIIVPSKTGGVIILFEDLLLQCYAMGIDFEVIDTNKDNYSNKVIAIILILSSSILNVLKVSHVSLHGTAKDYILIAPFIVFFSKLLGKKISLRKFAGNFDDLYDNASYIKKKVIEYVLKKSDVVFFETKYLVRKFTPQNNQTFLFPNVRQKPQVKTKGRFHKKFIFLGQVSKEKGIIELLEVSNLLDHSYTIDIYGSLIANMENINFHNYNICYKGAINHRDVQKTLAEYDVLILPSYREGYPGVIIEALSVGLPIIATNLSGIKEMVDESSSVLIDPKNVRQLKDAIESYDDMNYPEKSVAALRQFENYNSEIQTKLFFQKIHFQC